MVGVLIFIGLDDTDNLDSPGTGRLARRLADHLESLGMGQTLGVTRHQLLVHPSIPYTSHNSAASLGLDSRQDPGTVFEACQSFLKNNLVPGSDPGLCVATGSRVTDQGIAFGKRAQEQVLEIAMAAPVAAAQDILLAGLGPQGQGTIGALAAVGLRASGNDGRFIELRGIREVGGLLSVSEIKEHTGVGQVKGPDLTELGEDSIVDTQDWLRPRLIDHQPVLLVTPHPELSGGWISLDRPNRRHPERQLHPGHRHSGSLRRLRRGPDRSSP